MIGDKVTMKPRSFCEENDEGCSWMGEGHGDQLEEVSLDYEFEISDVSTNTGNVKLKGMAYWWNKHWFEISKQQKIESPWNE